MNIVAQNPFYELSYNPSFNRVYFRIKGFWRIPESVPQYLQDWFSTLKLTERGFTLLTDVSDMVTHPEPIKILHEKAIELNSIAGVSKIAEVAPSDKIATLQITSMTQKVNIYFSSFQNKQEAEAWLDSEQISFKV